MRCLLRRPHIDSNRRALQGGTCSQKNKRDVQRAAERHEQRGTLRVRLLCSHPSRSGGIVLIHFPQRSDHAFFAASLRSHDSGQRVMGFARASGARREGGVFGGRQSRGHDNLRAKVAMSIALHLGMIREPEYEAFFQLAPERLLDRATRAHLEAGSPL